jgi:hypothetical protein
MMKMKGKSNIEQHERTKGRKSPSHIYDREREILGG